MSVNICQSAINSVLPDSQSRMINAQQMQNSGVHVVNLSRVAAIERLVAPFVRRSVRHSATNASAAQPVCEHVGIVIATPAALVEALHKHRS